LVVVSAWIEESSPSLSGQSLIRAVVFASRAIKMCNRSCRFLAPTVATGGGGVGEPGRDLLPGVVGEVDLEYDMVA
jgi:hypothetical protein